MGSVLVRYRAPDGMRKVNFPVEGEVAAKELLLSLARTAGGELDKLKDQIAEGDHPGYIIMLNGANLASLGGLNTPINEGDELTILLMVSGG